MATKRATSNLRLLSDPKDGPSNRLMLVRLSISSWRPRKYDKAASDELAQLHGAASADEIARVNKILIDLDTISPLESRIAKLRNDVTEMTAPWNDRGIRVLPVEMYFALTKLVREGREEIESLAQTFARVDYKREIDAARGRLNGLFKESDYPDPMVIEQKFAVHASFQPLPNPEDARVWGIGAADAEAIRADVEKSVRETLSKAQADVCERLAKRATQFIEKVRKYHDGETSSLFTSAIENLREIVEIVLSGLNVTGDEQLTKVATELRDAIKGVNIEQLKTGEQLRVDKIAQVEKIAKRFSGVFGGSN